MSFNVVKWSFYGFVRMMLWCYHGIGAIMEMLGHGVIMVLLW